jgi:multidrug efflux pump subunit AcrB
VEDLVRHIVHPADFKMVVSNVGVVPDFSSLYTTNAGPYTATIQVALNEPHDISSFEYMHDVHDEMRKRFPQLRTFLQTGSMVDAILNMGMPAPIDIQVSSPNLPQIFGIAQDLATRIRELKGVGEVYIPQDMNYPAVRLSVDRVHAGELGLTAKAVVDNVITALNSNYMIAPNYWVDHKTGNDYYLTVQYYENGPAAIHSMSDVGQIPLRSLVDEKHKLVQEIDGLIQHGMSSTLQATRSGDRSKQATTLDNVVKLDYMETPTEVDHHQIQRVIDLYVTPSGEDLGHVTDAIRQIVANMKLPENVRVNLRGMVEGMQASFRSFALGLSLSVVLLYLILVAQFRSFKDPILIMLAVPMGFIGVIIILPLTHTTLNVMSLMGVLMLVGIAASNSILIVEFAHRLEDQGMAVKDAVITSCRVRLRPILMTSLATIIGMAPMALKLGTGSEQYAPLARAIIGGLTASVILTVFIVPAAYLLVFRKKEPILVNA